MGSNPGSAVITGYRNKGYDFTITSSTAYDHKWIYGRNIFDSISKIVDELFENYLSGPMCGSPSSPNIVTAGRCSAGTGDG